MILKYIILEREGLDFLALFVCSKYENNNPNLKRRKQFFPSKLQILKKYSIINEETILFITKYTMNAPKDTLTSDNTINTTNNTGTSWEIENTTKSKAIKLLKKENEANTSEIIGILHHNIQIQEKINNRYSIQEKVRIQMLKKNGITPEYIKKRKTDLLYDMDNNFSIPNIIKQIEQNRRRKEGFYDTDVALLDNLVRELTLLWVPDEEIRVPQQYITDAYKEAEEEIF